MTTGADGLLLDDAEDLHPFTTWTVSGLAAGPYTITTYAWAPDAGFAGNFLTGVKVNGGVEIIVGGPWTASGYVQGGTHAVDTLTLAAGADLVIELRNVKDYATFNGLQIQEGISPFTSYCAGDYRSTQCQCGNPGISGHG